MSIKMHTKEIALQSKNIALLLILIILLSSISCKKENMCDCLKGRGDDASITINTDAFQTLRVRNHVNVYLLNGTQNSVRIQGGDNIIPLITAEVNNNELLIEDRNTCNWIRDYTSRQASIYITATNLNRIEMEGTGNIRSLDTISSESFTANVWNSGIVDLSLHAKTVYSSVHAGVGDIILSGKSDLHYMYNAGSGFIRGENMKSASVYLRNKGRDRKSVV